MEERTTDYAAVNRANWESRVPLHEIGYDLDRYRYDEVHLSGVVQFDLPRLGDIDGLDVVHLQCHLGTDTLSLARLGGVLTGFDFSPAALEVARRLAADCDTRIDYVEGELYRAVELLGGERFDVVYTGIGALCWLPDIARWAQVVAGLLRPGGRLFIREGHPVLWAVDDRRDDELIALAYPYFETAGVSFSVATTYVEHEGEVGSPATIEFNHGLGEIVTALLAAGMRLTMLEEHRSLPWKAFDAMAEGEGGEWYLPDRPERLPLSYTLQTIKER